MGLNFYLVGELSQNRFKYCLHVDELISFVFKFSMKFLYLFCFIFFLLSVCVRVGRGLGIRD